MTTEFKKGDRVRYTGRSRTYAEPPHIGRLGTVNFAPGGSTVGVTWDEPGPAPFVYAANVEILHEPPTS